VFDSMHKSFYADEIVHQNHDGLKEDYGGVGGRSDEACQEWQEASSSTDDASCIHVDAEP
jgi:hypothetical protein